MPAARALKAGGANPVLWDDKASAREEAAAARLRRERPCRGRLVALRRARARARHSADPSRAALERRARARQAGVEVIGDIELFFRERARTRAPGKVVVITGTNGKSTTTALTAHLLAAAGKRVALGGNIGKAVLDLEPFAPDLTYVIELSSFQIELAPGL